MSMANYVPPEPSMVFVFIRPVHKLPARCVAARDIATGRLATALGISSADRKRYGQTMLNFPNRSRVFDPSRRAVRFWGYDSAMEWSFFVTEDALKRLQPNMGYDEASVLRAFDDNRNAIHIAAMRAYKRERKGFYELGATDF